MSKEIFFQSLFPGINIDEMEYYKLLDLFGTKISLNYDFRDFSFLKVELSKFPNLPLFKKSLQVLNNEKDIEPFEINNPVNLDENFLLFFFLKEK